LGAKEYCWIPAAGQRAPRKQIQHQCGRTLWSACCSPSVVRNVATLDEDRLDFELLEVTALNNNCLQPCRPACSPSVVRNVAILDEDRLDFELLEALVAHIDDSNEGQEGSILVFLPGQLVVGYVPWVCGGVGGKVWWVFVWLVGQNLVMRSIRLK